MNAHTGAYVPLHSFLDRPAVADALGCKLEDLVTVQGSPTAVKALSDRVRLGEAEMQARRARRKAQRAARKINR